jgi:hypothetical protein
MSNEDGNDQGGPSQQYNADLWNIDDPKISHGTTSIEAASDDEGKAKAHEWALVICRKEPKKMARLVVTGGSIYGSYGVVIDPDG